MCCLPNSDNKRIQQTWFGFSYYFHNTFTSFIIILCKSTYCLGQPPILHILIDNKYFSIEVKDTNILLLR